MSKCVKMTRDEPLYPGGPVTADVHPDEIPGMESLGWVVEKPESASKPSRRQRDKSGDGDD